MNNFVYDVNSVILENGVVRFGGDLQQFGGVKIDLTDARNDLEFIDEIMNAVISLTDNVREDGAKINDEENVVFKFNNQVEHQYILKSGNIYYINIENNNEKKIILCENVSSSKVFNYSNNKLDVNFIINDKKFSTSLNIKNIE